MPSAKPFHGNHPNRNDEKRVATVLRQKAIRNKAIAVKKLQGKSIPKITKEISKEFKPISKSRIITLLNGDDMKKMLEEESLKLASAVPDVTSNIVNAATSFNSDLSPEDKKISWEANKLIAQAHGLLPTSSQSIVHQTYINQTNNIIPPVIAELMKKHFGNMVAMDEKEVIDAEPVAIAE